MIVRDVKVVCVLVLLGLGLLVIWNMATNDVAQKAFSVDRLQSMLNVRSPPCLHSASCHRGHGALRCETVRDVADADVDLWNVPPTRYTDHGCPRRPSIHCTGRKPKALVVYMLHTRDSPHDMQPEMWNLNYFVQYGILGASQSTEMFERVDYVFTRMMPVGLQKETHAENKTQLCAEEGNIKLLWVPEGPCDLCAHHRVLEYLGGVERIKKKYAYLVYLNAGTRGPFQALDDPAWIDVLAMSGYDVWDAKDKPAPVMTGATVSPEHSIHVQSNFVGVHTSALEVVDEFLSRCGGDKMNCIFDGEVPVGAAFLRAGGWVHALSRNVTVRSEVPGVEAYAAMQRQHHPAMPNPMLTPIDVCAAMFMMHGGVYLRGIPDQVAAQASQLTLHQSEQRKLGGETTFKSLLGTCPFIRL